MSLKGDILHHLVMSEYVEEHSRSSNFTPRTIKDKRNTLLYFLRWLNDKPFNFESCQQFISYYRSKGNKISTIRHHIRVLKALINYLHAKGHIEENFSKEIIYPKLSRKPPVVVPFDVAEKIVMLGTEPGWG